MKKLERSLEIVMESLTFGGVLYHLEEFGYDPKEILAKIENSFYDFSFNLDTERSDSISFDTFGNVDKVRENILKMSELMIDMIDHVDKDVRDQDLQVVRRALEKIL